MGVVGELYGDILKVFLRDSKPGLSRLVKLGVAIEIIYFILGYYVLYIYAEVRYRIEVKFLDLEFKSFFFIILYSFLFYYIVIIKLSYFIFGYSLLCYRFLFIMLIIFILLAWKLENHLIKFVFSVPDPEKPHKLVIPFEIWMNLYEGKTPLTFSDYMDDYQSKHIFGKLVIEENKKDVYDGRFMTVTFFFIASVYSFFWCIYRFDPRLTNFVVGYFHPFTNFFETGRSPRLEDFTSAIVRFRHRWVNYFKIVYAKDENVQKWVDRVPTVDGKQTDFANLQRARKTSLGKNVGFYDIFFLGNLRVYPPLNVLVFNLEQPIITSNGFEIDWALLFLRHVRGDFSKKNNFYWKKYFYNDLSFWNYLSGLQTKVNQKVERVEKDNGKDYYFHKEFYTSVFDQIFLTNYLNNLNYDCKPNFEKLGLQSDYSEFLFNKKKPTKNFVDGSVLDVFTDSATPKTSLSLFGLINYWKSNKRYENSFMYKLKSKIFNIKSKKLFIQNNLNKLTYSEFLQAVNFDLDVPIYGFNNTIIFSNLEKFYLTDHNLPFLQNLFKQYDLRFSQIEENLGLKPNNFPLWTFNRLTWGTLLRLVEQRMLKIQIDLGNETSKGRLKNFFDFRNFFDRFSILFTKPLIDNKWTPMLLKNYLTAKTPINAEFKSGLLEIEGCLRFFEGKFGFGDPEILYNKSFNIEKSFIPTGNPWYVKTLNYIGKDNSRFVMPGFVGYYYPTPFMTPITTFGVRWHQYQNYRVRVASTVVGSSDNVLGEGQSTPLPMYTGVEAIMYVQPIIDLVNYLTKSIIKCLTYPVEFFITKFYLFPFNTFFSLIFFLHFTWFIHFYVYVFLFIYLFYYFIIYYYYKVGFAWFYEGMFESDIVNINANKIYWHTADSLWKNFKTPEQIMMLSLHSNLLLHYSFFNYLNYGFYNGLRFHSIFLVLSHLLVDKPIFNNFNWFSQHYNINYKFLKIYNGVSFFKNFFLIELKKQKHLLFTGGSDCSFDHLKWFYFEYLTQYSGFLSKTVFYIKNNTVTNDFGSILKQLTLLFSGFSLEPDLLFISNPLLDSELSGKLLIRFFSLFDFMMHKNLFEVFKNLFFWKKNEYTALAYSLLCGYKFNFLNIIFKSGLESYSLIDQNSFNFLSKLNVGTVWDDYKYWMLAFFRSFRFVSKNKFLNVNFSKDHEITGLQFARLAYANSWMGQSIYIRPFFNMAQHLWWTSFFYSKPLGLLTNGVGLNGNVSNYFDQIRNFSEKRYQTSFFDKTETVFGIIRTFSLPASIYFHKAGFLPSYKNNFDLSFPDKTIDVLTTNGSYNKTNPPLNVMELNITPKRLFNIFKILPPFYLKLYCSFLDQLMLIDTSVIPDPLKKDFSKYGIISFQNNENLFEKKIDSKILYKFESYLAPFDTNLDYADNNVLANWIFGFDLSFFFSQFITWDYFLSEFNKRPDFISLKKTPYIINNNILNNLLFYQDMNAYLLSKKHWLQKPFGVLDKQELFSYQGYKKVKELDYFSFTRNSEDPFSVLDGEFISSEIGYSSNPQSDSRSVLDSYTEDYIGERFKRFPFNPSLNKNRVKPIILGWVGDLFYATQETSAMYFSALYYTGSGSIEEWKTENVLNNLTVNNFKKQKMLSFFSTNNLKKKIFSKIFTFLNIKLHPVGYRYSFGPKAAARHDFFSWQSGITFDYKNGFYSLRPYWGFGHAFGNGLSVYDPIYGFYNSVRRVENDLYTVDFSTDAMDKIINEEKYVFEDPEENDYIYDLNNEYDYRLAKLLALPYRELYYCFHHPYFVGYFIFYFLFFMSKEYYLGLSNFSFKRLMVKNMRYNVDYSAYFGTVFLTERSFEENRFRKHMFRFGMYLQNPIKLPEYFNLNYDESDNLILNQTEKAHASFHYFIFLFKFFSQGCGFSTFDMQFLLDFDRIPFQSGRINWLAMDNPFSLNSYLVLNSFKTKLINKNFLNLYSLQTLSFAHFDTLKESFNFNLFYDWSNGVYLDIFNLQSYYSSYGLFSTIPNHIFDNPNFTAAEVVRNSEDKSKKMGYDVSLTFGGFLMYDLISHVDFAFSTFSNLLFLDRLLVCLLKYNNNFCVNQKTFFSFYFKDFDFSKGFLDGNFDFPVSELDINKFSSKLLNKQKYFFLIWFLRKNISYDMLVIWSKTGVLLSNKSIKTFKNQLKVKIFNGFLSIKTFYFKIGWFLKLIFFK